MIVGLSGRMGCGKSTVASFLAAEYGYQRHRMAGPLKAMLKSLGLTDDHIEGHLKEKPCALLGGKSPRHAMQTLGTDWGRHMIHPDLWVNAWAATLPSGNVVCEDVRFGNEAEAIRKAGGIVIRINRGNPDEPGHISELMPFEADYTIRNDGSVIDLNRKVSTLLYNLASGVSAETFGNP